MVAPVGAAALPFLAAPFFEPATSLLVAPRAALTHEETPPSCLGLEVGLGLG